MLLTPLSLTSLNDQTLEIVRDAVRIDRGLVIADANDAAVSLNSKTLLRSLNSRRLYLHVNLLNKLLIYLEMI